MSLSPVKQLHSRRASLYIAQCTEVLKCCFLVHAGTISWSSNWKVQTRRMQRPRKSPESVHTDGQEGTVTETEIKIERGSAAEAAGGRGVERDGREAGLDPRSGLAGTGPGMPPGAGADRPGHVPGAGSARQGAEKGLRPGQLLDDHVQYDASACIRT